MVPDSIRREVSFFVDDVKLKTNRVDTMSRLLTASAD